MALHGASRKKVEAALSKMEPVGKKITGSALSAERVTLGAGFHGCGDLPQQHRDELAAEMKSRNVTYLVYSYATPIAWVLADGRVEIPVVTYSGTTTHHQHICAVHLPRK